ncbi:MAG: ATP-binding protein [Blautia sp.]|nr:ATP-binding protein [Blautia sp.]MDY4515805.1 AAA family ATPase [Lachnospiraceae bacterium]
MGSYLNPGNEKFFQSVNSEIYVDKTGLISYCNQVINTLQRYLCISRPRRFGKSVTADMLVAYYSRGCDSEELFAPFEISQTDGYEVHRNQYHVIFLNMQEFLSRTGSMEAMLSLIKKRVICDMKREYPETVFFDEQDLIGCMQDLYAETGIPFVLVIDEWDCVFREYKEDDDAQKKYLDFLRDLLKDKGYIVLCYMTGILPVKKYGTHSALNMFDEFSMTFSGTLAKYVGFTEDEVRALCDSYQMDFEETKKWYDGYHLEHAGSVYNPRSVVSAMRFHSFQYYWNQTETFEALRTYIDMNFEGLKDDIVEMMNGKNRILVNTGSFSNDMVTFHSKDDVMTLLVHLGYLGYLSDTGEVFIPNHEILNEYVTAVSNSDWGEVSKALKNSRLALEAVWNREEEKVAEAVERAHYENSHLQYHDENALSYTISLAFYVARNFYTLYRELPTGKGFADMVFFPKKQYADRPALVIELKWNQGARGAIEQIKQKNDCESLKDYKGNVLLVGISYDKNTRRHHCIIEEEIWGQG